MPRTVAQEVSLASLRIDRAQARDFVTSVVCTCSFSVASLYSLSNLNTVVVPCACIEHDFKILGIDTQYFKKNN